MVGAMAVMWAVQKAAGMVGMMGSYWAEHLVVRMAAH
jgi:hypothetical protein